MIFSTSNHGDFSSRRSSRQRCFIKKVPLIISKNAQENTVNFIKKDTSGFLCNISKSTSFVKQIRPAASEHSQNHKVSDTMIWKQEFLWLILIFHEKNY